MKNAVLLGVFDGVHSGHKAALDALNGSGCDKKIVYTFNSQSVTTKGDRRFLNLEDEKRELLIKGGADEVISVDFMTVKDLSYDEFFEKVLINELGADVIICGENFRFGKGAKGTKDDIIRLCEKFGRKSVIVAIKSGLGETVSSTRIRNLIESGQIKTANDLLGYSYFINGEVIKGTKLGTRLGIKTLNVAPSSAKVLPLNGVYSTRCIIDGVEYKSISDLGTKPTVSDEGKRLIETHVFDFDKDIYGKTVKVEFLEFYRSEEKFASVDELKQTILKDINRRKESEL